MYGVFGMIAVHRMAETTFPTEMETAFRYFPLQLLHILM